MLILLRRKIAESASAAGDEDINALMSDYIREQKRMV